MAHAEQKPTKDAFRCSTDTLARCARPDELLAGALEPPIQTALHSLSLLPGMEPMLQSIVRDIDEAKTRVAVETYIYRDDKLGRCFGDALARAAARGVPTRLLYDPLGSEKTDPAFFDELRARGVDVRTYRPAEILAGTAWPRDHSRVIVIDRSAYTGGAAWGDEWLPKRRGGQGWHDVCLRIEGPCVEDFVHLFEQRWQEAALAIGTPLDFTTGDKYADLMLIGDTPNRQRLVYECYCRAIQAARRRVFIENAYFFPPPALLLALYNAAARGVDVRIILPGDSDLPLLQRAARAEFGSWIDHGLRVFAYQPCMLHSKFAVIDDNWCTVGTFNANAASIGLANEVNVFVYDPTFVARVAKLFLSDQKDSIQVTRAAVDARPLVERAVDRLANDTMNLIDIMIGPPSP
jgi:cardiolipin synthase